jgi:hypothetical protein
MYGWFVFDLNRSRRLGRRERVLEFHIARSSWKFGFSLGWTRSRYRYPAVPAATTLVSAPASDSDAHLGSLISISFDGRASTPLVAKISAALVSVFIGEAFKTGPRESVVSNSQTDLMDGVVVAADGALVGDFERAPSTLFVSSLDTASTTDALLLVGPELYTYYLAR